MVLWFLPEAPIRKLSNWPDGEIRTIVRNVAHTRGLTPAQFEEFVNSVRTFARSCLGVTTQDPGYLRFGNNNDSEV